MFSNFSPDIFVDTHTSNGADYQATLTLITTQPDKLGGPLGAWLEDVFTPMLYSGMAERGETMVPYVNSIQSTPDGGITDFLETPRYSTGYGALHHAIGFTTEAHMLKPFPDRVQATQLFLEVLLEAGRSQSNTLREKKRAQHTAFLALDSASVAWELDTTAVDALDFPGYEARYEWSNVTGERSETLDIGTVASLENSKPVSGFAGSITLEKMENTLVFGVDNQGRGSVIYMIDNPLFRGFWENGKLFFANALFLVQ